MAVNYAKKIADLGYDVQEADGLVIINGHGVTNVMLDKKDTDGLKQFADKSSHDERVQQEKETPERTHKRWVKEGRIEKPEPASGTGS